MRARRSIRRWRETDYAKVGLILTIGFIVAIFAMAGLFSGKLAWSLLAVAALLIVGGAGLTGGVTALAFPFLLPAAFGAFVGTTLSDRFYDWLRSRE